MKMVAYSRQSHIQARGVIMSKVVSLFFMLSFLLPMPLLADGPAAEPVSEGDLLGNFNFQKGDIDLPNGVARLEVPEEFRYIGPDDAQRFLEVGWGNPDGSGTLGMLLPVDTDLFGPEGWGVVITYQEDGYVSDEDAADIDYDELLDSMKNASEESNRERKKLGYEPVTLVGWARPPHYDAKAKKLYWAKELKFGSEESGTLNYNVRVLGRKGVLVMNAVSGMEQITQIEQRMDQVLAFAEFKEGYRYSDFDSGVDKVAAYGIAALIGGKVAAKVGLLAKLGAFLLAFKKVILVAVVAVGGFITKLFKRPKVIVDPPTLPESPDM